MRCSSAAAHMTGCGLACLALQVASEKDLEAVMAIDHFRGVELRKRLTEVRARGSDAPQRKQTHS